MTWTQQPENDPRPPVTPDSSAALLARAQEWLGCEPDQFYDEALRACVVHGVRPWPCERLQGLAALLADVAASAWDEGYRLDWTGGVRHDNPYQTGADQ